MAIRCDSKAAIDDSSGDQIRLLAIRFGSHGDGDTIGNGDQIQSHGDQIRFKQRSDTFTRLSDAIHTAVRYDSFEYQEIRIHTYYLIR
ncbi:hypothetical protein AVEN_170996-1 [Araneus ventricosus]|uniref:Uncharacterized protein n=1 Tax=Araneus ventricosus TaxID=182803 RepID=A0A4Y2GF36_ARAVE|nr:hypothetical protein AVEN_170996-1 [Araneus ventricosus]